MRPSAQEFGKGLERQCESCGVSARMQVSGKNVENATDPHDRAERPWARRLSKVISFQQTQKKEKGLQTCMCPTVFSQSAKENIAPAALMEPCTCGL